MASFAIIRGVEATSLRRALMIVDDLHDAEEIAWALNCRGQNVVVREVRDSPTGLATPSGDVTAAAP